MAEAERQWQYLTVAGDKRGPFPESTLMRMLVKHVPGLERDSYCWTPGMEEWQPVGKLQHFHALLQAEAAAWYYVDSKDGTTQVGPVDARKMASLLQEGEIDGLTMVWHQDLPGGWKPLSEVEELRQLVRLLMKPEDGEEEEDDDGVGMEMGGGTATGAAGGGGRITPTAEEQTFQPEEMPALPPSSKRKEGEGGKEKEGGKRSYVAEDGVKYRFNGQTNEWEEAAAAGSGGEESDAAGDEEEEEEEEDDDFPAAGAKAPAAGAAAGGGGRGGGGVKRKRRKKKKGGGWDKESNRWIYITGLPQDVTPEELEAHFKQVGILAVDPENQQPRIKIYRDEQGQPKGDASIAYVRPESVELAVEILNGGLLRPNCPVTISKAVFQQKGGGDGGGANKRRKVAEAKMKVARAAAKQALSWADEDDTGVNRAKALRIVILKNLFHPRECQTPGFVEELQEDLEGECAQLGPIEKMTIFERHPEGVVILKYATAFAAEQCVKAMNGRYFAGRKLQCFYWDGATDYTKAVYVAPPPAAAAAASGAPAGGEGGGGAGEAKPAAAVVVDQEEEEERRLEEFGDYLDNQELPPELELEVEGE